MTRYETLMRRISAGEKILLDGATGSEMRRRGVPAHTDGWFGGAALSDPEILLDAHAGYIETGANLIISNTFATHMGVLRAAGAEADFEALNRRSVEIAVHARDAGGRPDVLVAAGISHWSFTDENPPLDELERDAAAQLRILADAGAELVILEMMVDVDRMLRLISAAKTVDLPLWVGFSVGGEVGQLPDPNVMTLRDGELLSGGVDALKGHGVDAIHIMHTDVSHIDQCLDVMFDRWSGPIGVYAHSWPEENPISPVDYAALSVGWLERGVSLIGGCCGTQPEHLTELAKIPGLS